MFKQIYQNIVEYFKGRYTVIKSYDAESEIDLDGVIAITLDNIENKHNGNIKDLKVSIAVNGQTYTEQDKDKSVILQMFDYVFDKMDQDKIKRISSDIVGVLINSGTLQSDGETNNFSFQIQLFISKD